MGGFRGLHLELSRLDCRLSLPRSVVNDNRDEVEDAGEQEWPDTTVRLIAVAGINKLGRPCLFVMPADSLEE